MARQWARIFFTLDSGQIIFGQKLEPEYHIITGRTISFIKTHQKMLQGYINTNLLQAKVTPTLHELVNTYYPEVIWSDGDWEANDTYWNATEFIAWLYNDRLVWQ